MSVITRYSEYKLELALQSSLLLIVGVALATIIAAKAAPTKLIFATGVKA